MRSDESYVTSLGLEVLCLEIIWYFCCKQCLVDSRLWVLSNILAVWSSVLAAEAKRGLPKTPSVGQGAGMQRSRLARPSGAERFRALLVLEGD